LEHSLSSISNAVMYVSYKGIGANDNIVFSTATLTNVTTIQLERNTSDAAVAGLTLNIFIEEFFPGVIKSRQAVTITTSGGTGTATITGVTTAKTKLIPAGIRATDTGINQQYGALTLNSATQIQVDVNGVASIFAVQAIEYN
jgi:hypothetical protein